MSCSISQAVLYTRVRAVTHLAVLNESTDITTNYPTAHDNLLCPFSFFPLLISHGANAYIVS
jgi:hypothetical protein